MLSFISKLLHPPSSFSGTPQQEKVYQKGLTLLRDCEEQYLRLLRERKCKPNKEGLFRLRLFALNFAVQAMVLALGPNAHKESEAVYKALLKEAFSGLFLSKSKMLPIAAEIVTEHNRALLAEMKNVGSGQYALAVMLEASIRVSGCQMGASESSLIGSMVGANLAEWADLYEVLGGPPMQSYTEGFAPSDKDIRPLDES